MSHYVLRNLLTPSPDYDGVFKDFQKGSSINGSRKSLDTVLHSCNHDISSSSVGSLRSISSRPLYVENTTKSQNRTPSCSTLLENTKRPTSSNGDLKQASGNLRRNDEARLDPRDLETSNLYFEAEPLEDIDLNISSHYANRCKDATHLPNSKITRKLSFKLMSNKTIDTNCSAVELSLSNEAVKSSVLITGTAVSMPNPLKRCMNSLRHKKSQHKGVLRVRHERWSLDDFDNNGDSQSFASYRKKGKHEKSSSWSSSGIVEAFKSAAASLKSSNIDPRSRKLARSSFLRSSNRSSRLSHPTNQASIDSGQGSMQMIDEAAWNRAVQRRKTMDELIDSEESYVSDLKVLLNVYFTLLASASAGSLRLSSHIHRNVTEILDLHEEILSQIRRVTQHSDLRSDIDARQIEQMKSSMRVRSHSVDSAFAYPSEGPTTSKRNSISNPSFIRPMSSGSISDPREAAEVAKVFSDMVSRFFIYEEYGAKYEPMLRDLVSTSKEIANWHLYERSIEALANSLSTKGKHAVKSKKSLTFEDLLIKPIQRVCKYPLLFADLFKNMPVIDGPESHVEVEKALCRLREVIKEINKATNDPETRARIQRSWHLQDLLVLPDECTATVSLRVLGHANLCGVLFVVYQSSIDVHGEYMLCVLFKSYFLLATPKQGGSKYDVVAILNLKDIQIEAPDNGSGLQSHTAPYSWKILFESDQRLYELILCACSAREEDQWKISLAEQCAKETQMQMEDHTTMSPLSFSISLDVQPLGYSFSPTEAGSFTRPISIQRAATVNPRTNVSQVIIRNTNTANDHSTAPTSTGSSIGRSQSLLTTNRVPILAPKRTDRLRMECNLMDVWTRDLLPYPGMGSNRGEHLIRTSASSMMRKLSRASKHNTFTKRSTSYASTGDDKYSVILPEFGSITEVEGSEQSGTPPQLSTPGEVENQNGRRRISFDTSPSKGSIRSIRGPRNISVREDFCRSGSILQAAKNQELETALLKEKTVKKNNSKIHLKTFTVDGIKGWFL